MLRCSICCERTPPSEATQLTVSPLVGTRSETRSGSGVARALAVSGNALPRGLRAQRHMTAHFLLWKKWKNISRGASSLPLSFRSATLPQVPMALSSSSQRRASIRARRKFKAQYQKSPLESFPNVSTLWVEMEGVVEKSTATRDERRREEFSLFREKKSSSTRKTRNHDTHSLSLSQKSKFRKVCPSLEAHCTLGKGRRAHCRETRE